MSDPEGERGRGRKRGGGEGEGEGEGRGRERGRGGGGGGGEGLEGRGNFVATIFPRNFGHSYLSVRQNFLGNIVLVHGLVYQCPP